MKNYLKYFFLLSSAFVIIPCDAAVRVSNQSRVFGNYSGQNTQALQEQYVQSIIPVAIEPTVEITAPVVVEKTELDKCSMIYPGGEFQWATPTLGMMRGMSPTCTAVVEMRFVYGTDDIVVARANLAAGDSVECNIGNFPESSYLPAATEVIFPADREPTINDVKSVMNNEQKKNAGLKIAAGTVILAVAGNLLTDKNPTTGRKNATGTVIGGLTGAAIMTGNTYGGKVAGDMILSAGVNAAAGGAVGNMVASGQPVLRIEKCNDLSGTPTTCLWGVIEQGKSLTSDDGVAYYNINSGETVVCKGDSPCHVERLIGIKLDKNKSLEQARLENFAGLDTYVMNTDNMISTSGGLNQDWVKITSAIRPEKRTLALVTDVPDKAFGQKEQDWDEMRGQYKYNLYGRTSDGKPYKLPDNERNIEDFYPLMVDAGDGSLIDLDNKARLGGTLIGAGTGAGLGAFTAYQGATDEIDARWVAAVTEYKDSLQKVYCATGTRYLSQYNDIAVIPVME